MRTRIVRLAVSLAALTILVFGVPLAVAGAQFLIDSQYRDLEAVADAAVVAVSGDLTAPAAASGVETGSPDVQVTVYDAGGARISGVGPETAPDIVVAALGGSGGNGTIENRYAAAATVTDGDSVVGAVMATAPRSSVLIRIAVVWVAMVALAAGALVLAWALARRQARQLVHPLQKLSGVADRLGGGDFTARGDPSGVDEIDALTDAVNDTAVRLGMLLERERAFSADASHQLRTPLTGMRLQLEAALDQPDADLGRAITEALSSADRLEATIDEMLALARDVPVPAVAVEMPVLLADIRRRWHSVLAAQGRPLRVRALDRRAEPLPLTVVVLHQVVDVLVDNALRHGSGSVSVVVRVLERAAVAVDVSDEGAALEQNPAELFRRRDGASRGHGIGLALARRLAEAQGGRLRLSAVAPPTFTLILPFATGPRQTSS